MSFRPILAILSSAALVFVVVPILAYAEYPLGYSAYSAGTLLVYVQVNNKTEQGLVRIPADFTVAVNAQNPSPASFTGSLNGVNVSVFGDYAVSVLGFPGFTPTYSMGCTGNLSNGGKALCIVTENANGDDYTVVRPYPYPYTGSVPLTCSPAYQTVVLGQAATFFANSDGGTYNWSTPDRTFLGTKSTLTTILRSSGVQTVIVSNNTQTATCTVNVVGVSAPVVYAPPSYIQPISSSVAGGVYPAQTLSSAYVPALPNTGIEPLSVTLGQGGGAPLAFVIVMLGALGILMAPYVRKIIITPVR